MKTIINFKTEAWKNQKRAENHLNESGLTPRGLFASTFKRIILELNGKKKVLDIGCGHGRLSFGLADCGFNVVSVDVSDEMLRLLIANKGDREIQVRKADAHNIPADNEEFDAVVSYDFMPHFPDWDVLLEEQARVCKMGGRIIFGANFSEHKTFAYAHQKGSFSHQYTSDVKDTTKQFWGEISLDELQLLCDKIGLVIVNIIPINLLYDSFLFGRALGNEQMNSLLTELEKKVMENSEVAKFYEWIDANYFQKLDMKFSCQSIVVLEKTNLKKLSNSEIILNAFKKLFTKLNPEKRTSL